MLIRSVDWGIIKDFFNLALFVAVLGKHQGTKKISHLILFLFSYACDFFFDDHDFVYEGAASERRKKNQDKYWEEQN